VTSAGAEREVSNDTKQNSARKLSENEGLPGRMNVFVSFPETIINF